MKIFFVQFFCVFLPPLLNIFCFCEVHIISVLYCAPLCTKCSLVSLIFLKRSLVLPVVLFSSVSLHYLLKMAFFSLLAILWNSAFSWIYIFPFLFACHVSPFLSYCKASSDICLVAFLFWGDGFCHHLLYNVTNFGPLFFRHFVYQIQSLESICISTV